MSQKSWILWSLAPITFVVLGIISLVARPVAADTQPQVVYQTPTARPDGRVIYIVQANDTCLRIQLLTGTTIEELRTLNKLDQNCTINPGQELLLKVITPVASPTPNPKFSPTPLLPTPTPPKGNGSICVLLFDDVNGDAIRQASEVSLAGGAVSISTRLGSFSKTVDTTDAADPLCTDVPEGEYNISMAIPSGYNSTKAMNTSVNVQAGDQAIFEFGAQKSSVIPQNPEKPGNAPQQENSLPIAIMGGLLVFGGIGLGAYVLFRRSRPAGYKDAGQE